MRGIRKTREASRGGDESNDNDEGGGDKSH